MAIPRKTLLLEEFAGIYFCTLEARNSEDVRGKFEASTCALTESQHGVETLYHCGKLVWRSKGMLAAYSSALASVLAIARCASLIAYLS
jgi:hypothetical protein